MQWLKAIVDEAIKQHPEGEVLVESGASPSGTYHFGHLREIITCDAIKLALEARGRNARHVHFVDDLDGLRKIPVNIPSSYEKYLGKPLCDIPAPDNPNESYADFFVNPFLAAAEKLGIQLDAIRSHKKYRAGFFVPAIEQALNHVEDIRKVLQEVSGHKLGDNWSPIQILEGEYLKNRKFKALDAEKKIITYIDSDGNEQTTGYANGEVKLDWRIDWPARWSLLGVNVEPAGRDHSTRGGSFDTGQALLKTVFNEQPIQAVPYDFVNRAGDPKKMSASKGTGISVDEVIDVLPPEVIRFFMLRYPPSKRLYFDTVHGVVQLMDDFAALLSKLDKTKDEEMLLYICRKPIGERVVVSRVPFSHLVESYQAALKDSDKTLEVLARSEYSEIVKANAEIIKEELAFIDKWLEHWAPDDVKFTLVDTLESTKGLDDTQKGFLRALAEKVAAAPENADGQWFHEAIYSLKDAYNLQPRELFTTLYQVLIGKNSGPRAGWFLSMLPKDWLVRRLRLEA